VNQHQGRRRFPHGNAKDLPRMHQAGGESSLGDDDFPQNAMPTVQQENDEELMLDVPQMGVEMSLHVLGAADDVSRPNPPLGNAATDLERGPQRGDLRGSDSRDPGPISLRLSRKPGEALASGQQEAGAVECVPPTASGSQHESQELCIAQRAGSVSIQTLPWTIRVTDRVPPPGADPFITISTSECPPRVGGVRGCGVKLIGFELGLLGPCRVKGHRGLLGTGDRHDSGSHAERELKVKRGSFSGAPEHVP
jgi:hypothetical protein